MDECEFENLKEKVDLLAIEVKKLKREIEENNVDINHGKDTFLDVLDKVIKSYEIDKNNNMTMGIIYNEYKLYKKYNR